MIKKMIELLSQPGAKHLSAKTMIGASLISAQVLLSLGSMAGVEPLPNKADIDIVETYSDNKLQTNADKQIKTEESINYSKLNFKAMKYGGTYYLTLDKQDMLTLIAKAIKEVDNEYIKNDNKAVFAEGDSRYSYFDEYYLLGMMTTETDLRMIELKNPDNLFDVENYKRYCDNNNKVQYNGLGMMNRDAIEYIKHTDRKQVNNFKNYEYLPVGNTNIKLAFENLNPYDYVLSKKPQTENEFKQSLAENIMFTTKCSYIYLNRIVKDNVKKGTHDAGYNALMSYSQLNTYSNKEKQIFFSLLCYNQGPSATYNAMMNKKLFEKDLNGDYCNNIKYSIETFEHAQELRLEFGKECMSQ